ncbi:MAG: hypothetical protein IPL65_03825 [Lewinellaceae bacterium]|nr:hypothetical protein [Lewinellaceae bacterium]
MQKLDEKYLTRLAEISDAIQKSPDLAQYLDEEEDEFYNELRQAYEPLLSEIHHQVAAEAPLQLATLEKTLLEDRFEGLYLPRVLGYSVLRGEINDQFRYVRPNDHFKEILLAICHSPHFEQLRKRIGQSIQVGFAMSSDIWITNLMSQVENKRIRFFLQQQRNERFWDIKEREDIYLRYSSQFRNELYFSADFPKSFGEMKANFSALRQFLIKRYEVGGDNSSLKSQIKIFLDNEALQNSEEYVEMLAMFGNFMDLEKAEQDSFKAHFKRERTKFDDFDEKYLSFLLHLYESELNMDASHDNRMLLLTDRSTKDKISEYYRIADKVHSLGYVHPETMEAVQQFCNSHEGLSVEMDCLRQLILNYFERLINGLTTAEYLDFSKSPRFSRNTCTCLAMSDSTLPLKNVAQIHSKITDGVHRQTRQRLSGHQAIRLFSVC